MVYLLIKRIVEGATEGEKEKLTLMILESLIENANNEMKDLTQCQIEGIQK